MAAVVVTANLEHRLPEIRSDWARRGYGFEYWIDPPGQVWRDFVHDTDELVILVEGEIEVELDGVARTLTVGEEVLIPAGVCHTVRNTGVACNRWCFGYRNR